MTISPGVVVRGPVTTTLLLLIPMPYGNPMVSAGYPPRKIPVAATNVSVAVGASVLPLTDPETGRRTSGAWEATASLLADGWGSAATLGVLPACASSAASGWLTAGDAPSPAAHVGQRGSHPGHRDPQTGQTPGGATARIASAIGPRITP